MKAIEAMKLVFVGLAFMAGAERLRAILAEAISREEAQSVEPVAEALVTFAGMNPMYSPLSQLPVGKTLLFTHPAPAKQPLSAERAALISEIQSLANLPKQLLPIVKRAVDMLAADAQDIDWQDMYQKQKREKEAMAAKYEKDTGPLAKAGPVCQAQQVAVPQVVETGTPASIQVTEEMHRAAVRVLHRAPGLDGLPQRMMDAMLAAAPKPPQAAPRVPMPWGKIEEVARSTSNHLEFARLVEAHHGIGVKP